MIKESPLHVGIDEFDFFAWLYLVEHIQKEVHLISHKIRSSPEMSLVQNLTSHFRGNLNLLVSPSFFRVVQKCSVEVRTSSPQVTKVNIDIMLPLTTDSSKIFSTFHFASFYKPEHCDSATRQGWGLDLWTILPRHPQTGACLGSFRIWFGHTGAWPLFGLLRDLVRGRDSAWRSGQNSAWRSGRDWARRSGAKVGRSRCFLPCAPLCFCAAIGQLAMLGATVAELGSSGGVLVCVSAAGTLVRGRVV